jgi:hypothetical protein
LKLLLTRLTAVIALWVFAHREVSLVLDLSSRQTCPAWSFAIDALAWRSSRNSVSSRGFFGAGLVHPVLAPKLTLLDSVTRLTFPRICSIALFLLCWLGSSHPRA